MSVVVKASLGSDVRRIDFTAATSDCSFGQLQQTLAQLFGITDTPFVLKYTDNEGDSVTLSSDRELMEALVCVKASTQATRAVLRVHIHPIPAPPTPTRVPQRCHQRQQQQQRQQQRHHECTKSLNEAINEAMKLAQAQELMRVFGVQPDTVASEADAILSHLMSLPREFCTPQRHHHHQQHQQRKQQHQHQQQVVHGAFCDHCDSQIVGVRYKCGVCSDFDLCQRCEALLQYDNSKRGPSAVVHTPGHLFVKVRDAVPLGPQPLFRRHLRDASATQRNSTPPVGCGWRSHCVPRQHQHQHQHQHQQRKQHHQKQYPLFVRVVFTDEPPTSENKQQANDPTPAATLDANQAPPRAIVADDPSSSSASTSTVSSTSSGVTIEDLNDDGSEATASAPSPSPSQACAAVVEETAPQVAPNPVAENVATPTTPPRTTTTTTVPAGQACVQAADAECEEKESEEKEEGRDKPNTRSPVSPFEEQLKVLALMGFGDPVANALALGQARGDIVTAVHSLLG
eukprot:TRINITY_DN1511_c3_g1_i2.p1 TRINITY_DN1511_c3_g1~~TRINITY_DN1511_c3_g1_i2.p1  ORF type:complete len:514 (+),score=139.30 TRINITY_DN1511_c3_g1_i2:117-1658(+)